MAVIKKVLLVVLAILLVLLFLELKTNRAEVKASLLDEIRSPAGAITKDELPQPNPVASYLARVERRNIFQPVVPKFLEDIRPKWTMRLTGTIIVPGKPPVAFIIDPAGKEGLYGEGDKLAGGIIKSIQTDQAIWSDGGNELLLKIGEMSPIVQTPSEKTRPIEEQPVISPTDNIQIRTAAEIARHLKPLIAIMSPEVAKQRINEITGIEIDEIPAEKDLPEYVTRIIQISQNGITEVKDPDNQVISLKFSTVVNQDKSAQNPGNQFSTSDKCIYACFLNEGNLKGLKSVVARWITLPDGNIISLHSETISPETQYNYVWLDKKNGLAKGTYQVEIFKPGDMTMAARGRFDVK